MFLKLSRHRIQAMPSILDGGDKYNKGKKKAAEMVARMGPILSFSFFQ